MTRTVARFFDDMADGYGVLEPWYEHLYAVLDAILACALARPAGSGGGLALDAGCGTGFQATRLEALGYRVHGMDLSAGLLAVARRRLPGAHLARADLEALPYPDGVFDAVTCCGSTLSFVERPSRALGELARVLRPGGRLLLECEHRTSLDLGWALLSSLGGDALGYGVRPGVAWRQLTRRPGASVVVDYPGYPPLRLFPQGELRDALVAAGLRPLRAWGIHAATNLIPSTILHRPALPRLLRAPYAALRRLDGRLAASRLGQALANSLVVLSERAGRSAAPEARAA